MSEFTIFWKWYGPKIEFPLKIKVKCAQTFMLYFQQSLNSYFSKHGWIYHNLGLNLFPNQITQRSRIFSNVSFPESCSQQNFNSRHLSPDKWSNFQSNEKIYEYIFTHIFRCTSISWIHIGESVIKSLMFLRCCQPFPDIASDCLNSAIRHCQHCKHGRECQDFRQYSCQDCCQDCCQDVRQDCFKGYY